MPTPIELALYQLGIRLTQCRELYKRVTTGWPLGPTAAFSGPHDIALLQHALRGLGATFHECAHIGGLHEGMIEAGKALVQDCLGLSETLPRYALVTISAEGEVEPELECQWEHNLNVLEDEAERIGTLNIADGARSTEWFRLGMLITDGKWRHKPRLARAKLLQQDRKPSAHKYGNSDWVWSDPEEVARLFATLGVTQKEVFPEIEENPQSGQLLPYDPIDYWPWYKVEVGLKSLEQIKMPGTLAAVTTQTSPQVTVPNLAEVDDIPPEENDVTLGYLDLVLHPRRRNVTRTVYEGTADLSSSLLGWGLLRAFANERGSFLDYDALRPKWRTLGGKADDPEEGTVQDAIATLNKELRNLGIEIKAKRNLGWRLIKREQPTRRVRSKK